ncbi:MAG TPA: FAD-linked oxidase C-terminal domain-containing protein [Gemmatimonadaceae bacterium]
MAVAVPHDVDDLSRLTRWARQRALPLIARGSGSSMPGGAIGDGIIVDLSRWRDISGVDVPSRTVSVGPGVLRAEVDAAARGHGLRFPVDPSSGAFCTIGGMTATNAAGPHSMHFGSMRAWVRAVDCVFDDGSRAEVRRGAPWPSGVPAIERFASLAGELRAAERAAPSIHAGVSKDSSGYGVAPFAESGDLVDLLVGSEGTLAFFTRIELSLAPAAGATSSVFGAFSTLDDAVAAAVRARDAGAVACELLDRTFLEVVATGGGTGSNAVPSGAEAALLAEVEGTNAETAGLAARQVEQLFRESHATAVRVALDEPTETELWELRHAASPILSRLDPNLKSMQFIEDCAVPASALPAYVRGVRRILSDNDTRVVIFGHAGDAHVHVNPLVDVRRPDWRERVSRILDAVTDLAASLGGTLTGEHGDGRLRTPLMARVWSADALRRFGEVKRAFDPTGILNPGVKVRLAGESPLGDVKYDPNLAPLTTRARAALETVEARRAYARSRLDLLDGA